MVTELKHLSNIHEGSMAFVIGSGPSLHFQEISPLKDYVTITVNSSILKVPNSDYFVSDDEGIQNWNYYKETLKNSSCVKLLYKQKLSSSVKHLDNVLLFDHKTWYDARARKYCEGGIDMSKNPNDPIIGARTSLATAINWAYIMGCSPIVLLGADCCYYERYRYFWQFPGEKKAIPLNNQKIHSFPDKGKRDGKGIDTHCDDFIKYWDQFAHANKNKVDIIYASEGGILKCFPSMKLIEVLEKYKDRAKTNVRKIKCNSDNTCS